MKARFVQAVSVEEDMAMEVMSEASEDDEDFFGGDQAGQSPGALSTSGLEFSVTQEEASSSQALDARYDVVQDAGDF